LDWDALVNKDGHVVVRVRKDVLTSDEAIVGVLSHEMHELTSVKELVDENGGLSARDIHGLVAPGRRTTLHDQAWDVADLRVRIMREPAGSAERQALEQRLNALEERLRTANLEGGTR
jgi:hypothetical protein